MSFYKFRDYFLLGAGFGAFLCYKFYSFQYKRKDYYNKQNNFEGQRILYNNLSKFNFNNKRPKLLLINSDLPICQIMNSRRLPKDLDIYKISLDLEYRNIWEFYVEIGQYKFALQTLTKEDKYMKPILYKLYANQLFNQKKYLDAAEYYAFSEEKFEHICLKFLKYNNLESLLKYLSLIFHFKIMENKNHNKNSITTINKTKNNFIEKYLLSTWIFELLIIKKDKYKNDEIIPFIRDYTRNNIHGKDYIDKNILYFVLNSYGSFEELIEFAKINQDYELVIFNLINSGKAIEAFP